MADLCRKNLTPHPYRRDDPLSIRKEIRHVYRKDDPTCIQGEADPSSIQKEPSWALNEVTID